MPTMTGVSIIPTQVDTDSAANVTYSYTGSGTLDIQINWYVGGNWVYGNATSLAHGNFTLGASITVQVSVSDGTDNASSLSTAKIVQAVPTVSGVSIIPSQVDTDSAAMSPILIPAAGRSISKLTGMLAEIGSTEMQRHWPMAILR